MCDETCNQCTKSCFDLDRMQEALKNSDQSVRIPNGLTLEQMMQFMLSTIHESKPELVLRSDEDIEKSMDKLEQAFLDAVSKTNKAYPIPKSLHDRIQALRSKAEQLKGSDKCD